MKPKMVAILILVIVLVVFIVQNTNVADVHLLFWTISMSIIILLFFVALLGFAIGYLAHHFITERKKKE